MPKLRKLAKRLPYLSKISTRESAFESIFLKELPNRISASLTKSALIPFSVRSLLDQRSNKVLTPIQDKVVRFLKQRSLDTKLMRQFEKLPKNAQKAFDQNYFKVSQIDTEKLLINTLSASSMRVHKDLQTSMKAKKDYVLSLGFEQIFIPYESIIRILGGGSPPKPQPVTYNFNVSYRGITTLQASDRSGGVEPYLVSSFCRIPTSGGVDILVSPFVVKQTPWNLGDMANDEWMPSGGQQDSAGNPSNPITLYNGNFQDNDPAISYLNITKVMEEDGGQGSQIAADVGAALVTIGGALVPANAIAGAIVIGIGAICELIAAIWGSSDADDLISDLLIFYSISTICSNTTVESQYQAVRGDNNWILYIGEKSTKL